MIEVTCYAPDRATAAAFLKEVGIAQIDPTNLTTDLVPIAEVNIHPFRESETIAVIETPAVLNSDGSIKTPAVLVSGWHFNLRFYGTSEQTLIYGLQQTDEHGNQLGLFVRTHILDLVQARTGTPPVWKTTDPPVPPGYESDTGVRAFDPTTITNRRNVWA